MSAPTLVHVLVYLYIRVHDRMHSNLCNQARVVDYKIGNYGVIFACVHLAVGDDDPIIVLFPYSSKVRQLPQPGGKQRRTCTCSSKPGQQLACLHMGEITTQ